MMGDFLLAVAEGNFHLVEKLSWWGISHTLIFRHSRYHFAYGWPSRDGLLIFPGVIKRSRGRSISPPPSAKSPFVRNWWFLIFWPELFEGLENYFSFVWCWFRFDFDMLRFLNHCFYKGITPCLRWGRSSRFDFSTENPAIIFFLVSDGSITSSMYPRSAAI